MNDYVKQKESQQVYNLIYVKFRIDAKTCKTLNIYSI